MKISKWLTVLSVLILFLIVVGGAVRNLGAGLSCPDWPLCKGKLIPPMDLQVFAEYFHRLFAASVSMLTLGITGLIFYKKNLRDVLGRSAGLALALLASQVVLGGLTVLQLLKSEIVTLHLATGTAFFATIIYMTLKARHSNDHSRSVQSTSRSEIKPLSVLSLVTSVIVYVQIILGGVVSSHYAGLACPDFPTCLGRWWPGSPDENVAIQVLHRLGATTVFLAVLFYVVQIFRKGNLLDVRGLKSKALLIAGFLLLQIALGVGNVLWRLPVALSVAHLAVAECLFALLLISTYEIRHANYLRLR